MSQNAVTGNIADSVNTPVPFIAIGLFNSADSSLSRGTITSEGGNFSFNNIKPGAYFLRIKTPGFAGKETAPFKIDSTQILSLPVIVLKPEGISLDEVSVSTSKKVIEFRNGNITVNIEDSPLATGNSVYDLLTRLPGLTIVDDVIYIQGKAGIRILIDERLQQASGTQLINLLKSLNATAIEKIEILKNPPVKYDAAGSGFISIKTKKVKLSGFSGSSTISYSQGFYANKDGGLSLNYKGQDFAVFSSVNIGDDVFRYVSIYDRTITVNSNETQYHQVTGERNQDDYVSYNAGTDWYLNKKNTIGIRIDGSQGRHTPLRHGNNFLSDSSTGYSRLEFGSVRPNTWSYLNYNLNSEHKLDTNGTMLRFSLDYSPNHDKNKGYFENYFLNTSGAYGLQPRIIKSDNNLAFTITSGKLDFEKKLRRNFKIETGAKAYNTDMLSDYTFLNKDNSSENYLVDSQYTNTFKYKEQIVAGYFNVVKDYKKYNLQAGLRSEHTHVLGTSITSSIKYERQYLNMFPMLSAAYNPSQNHSWQMSFNRRINRPDYGSFNPYKFYVNLLVSFKGNPYLQPEYYNTLELSHNYKNSINNALSYSRVQNIFFGYPIQNDSTKEVTNNQSNLKGANIFSYNFYLQRDVVKWWMLSLNGIVNYLNFAGDIDGLHYTNTSLQGYVFINNQLTLPHAMVAEINGQFLAPGQAVIFKNRSRWALNLALRKSFFEKKMQVVIGANDIFFSMVYRNTGNYLNFHSRLFNSSDTRRFRISLSYNFGKIKVQQRQAQSNQEEKSRLSH